MRLLVFIVFLSFFGKAQIDSAITLPMLGINLGGDLPFADLAERFGPNLKAGGSFMVKTKRNWIYGLDYSLMFGRNVREDVISQLKNPDGFVTDNEGYPADLRITQRLMALHFTAGRVFKLASANPNSGLMICVGAGVLQHKINIYDQQNKIAAFKEERKYGFDRLSVGFSLSQFVGYLFLSESRYLNFYTGFEFYQAFTTNIRKVNYDTGLPDSRKRFDALGGIRFGWILPLYKKKPNDFYYD